LERQNKGENQAGQIFTAERHGIEVGEVDRRLGLPDFITVGWSTTWVAAMKRSVVALGAGSALGEESNSTVTRMPLSGKAVSAAVVRS
jgi:hypothetical protein